MVAKTVRLVLSALIITLSASSAHAGRIVVNHDEWTLSNTGFASAGAANATAFVNNLASFMNINGGSCSFLVYSSNFGLTGSSFGSAMTGAGCTLTQYTGAFDTGLGTLANYDGVFLALSPSTYSASALTTYVNSGGSAYIAAGTGVGGSVFEANHWNPFLNSFGLAFGTSYNGCCGVDVVLQSHVLETGVSQLYYNNGNTVSLFGSNPNASIIEFSNSGLGLLGVYDDVRAVPEPATLSLLVLGLAAAYRRSSRGNRG